jgi:DNA-binding CsgD family transcriptional regulator
MADKQREYARLIRRGMTNAAACRQLGIDRKTGHWWKNGGTVTRGDVTRVVKPIVDRLAATTSTAAASTRYLSAEERIQIADGVRAGLTPTEIARKLGRAVSTVTSAPRRPRAEHWHAR